MEDISKGLTLFWDHMTLQSSSASAAEELWGISTTLTFHCRAKLGRL